MTDRLLKIQSSFLEAYLIRITQSIQPENLVAHDLLWRYYKTVSNWFYVCESEYNGLSRLDNMVQLLVYYFNLQSVIL